MKNKYITRLLACACVPLSFVFFASCDDDEGGGSVELLSFGPSGVKPGDEIVFIGQNLDKVTAVVFHPSVEVSRSGFTSSSAQQIKLTVPQNVETGKVVLKAPSGDIESKTIFSLEVPVVISGFPEEAKPGTDITITGEYLNWVESITFNDGITVTEFASRSLNQLVVTVPMTAKTGFLEFITGGTEPLIITTENPLVVTLPAVTMVSPASVRHADNLTLTGTDLDLVAQITFPGGASVPKEEFGSQSETQIVVTVPVTATDGVLKLTAPSGVEVNAEQPVAITLPKVTSLSPSDAQEHVGGNSLTMIGTDLDLVAKIKFPGVAALVTNFAKSSTQIEVVIPNGAQGGTIIFTTIHDFIVPVTASFGDQLVLTKPIFDDAVHAPLGAGSGWGGVTTDVANTENPRVGSVSVKVTFANSWGGGCQFGNWDGQSLSTQGTAYYAFSIYGGAGTDGKEINVNVAGTQVQVAVEEGKWKDVQIPLSSFNNPASISEVWFQDRGWAGTVWIDHIGLK